VHWIARSGVGTDRLRSQRRRSARWLSTDPAPLPRGGALEIGFAVGVDQVHGSPGAGLQALGEMGAALELETALRIDPRWAVGAHASGSVYGGARTFGRGAAAGLHITRRFLPHRPVQPWISVGAGWRAQWLSAREGDGPCHGVELVRLRVGVDQAVTPRMSLSPVLGVAAARGSVVEYRVLRDAPGGWAC
jgi:hypothetical protein